MKYLFSWSLALFESVSIVVVKFDCVNIDDVLLCYTLLVQRVFTFFYGQESVILFTFVR